ncbi:hypothetical protein M430DRAFT_30779 [Amorphotheca resinae ATCC 22711]|jgi:hypothetical protein|uniref:F-box domain-containing protein n=1 Tax=Amorphotheca resinae ATCC 22711 TaxID=857342 RepID=A0A2T3ATX5_AMORE|nr:hypothetical protein M430DRAFT_30779 [Amorphotheca resinae ATCC 22711]PSS10902.1 hypothetical protein M430DRAFT_30779 [Amorphotheca resinae ATCC 22711]
MLQKVSAFAKVPPEVLENILTFALVAEGDVRPYASVTREDQFKQMHGTKSDNLSPNSFLPILLVNKRFYREGIAIAYRDNSFNFTSLATYAAFAISLRISKRSRASARKITKVSITLDVAGDAGRISDLWSFIYPRDLELCSLTASLCDITLQRLFKTLPNLSHLQVCTSLFQCTYMAPNAVKRTTRLQPMMPTCRHLPMETRLQHINFAFDNPYFNGRKKAKRTHQVLLYSQLRHDFMVPGIYRTFTTYMRFLLKEIRKRKELEAAAQLAASSDPSALSSQETSDESEQPDSSAVPAPAPAPAAET